MSTLIAAGDPADETAEAGLERAIELLTDRRVAFLTGAGVSTDSGIPDYRGQGAPVRTPMTVDQFLSNDDAARKRYWAGSHLGWKRFDGARPNAGHRAIALLEEAGIADGVITQNVDGLHVRAGSRRVVDLHGSMDRVSCLSCGQSYARSSIAERMTALNPWLDTETDVTINPDGDAEVGRVDEIVVPVCTVCGGMLKPDVVFFGEFIPTEKYAEAAALVRGADALVIAGSSLVVNSGIRLLELARRKRLPIVVINRGVTKADGRADVKLDAGASETLTGIAARLVPSAFTSVVSQEATDA
ncbi:NAD-dependent deacetylase [Plantibacter sp. PA-3-X8]|uniref:Sir2 family NAD-dependent protein deacetylase n=1 Tax=unclassified Plantibacter TaxID=2624265 RepID=UPI000F5F036C|nr:Sir2 family NAD-dependent protein deacetylase [Plantibacter sp. PA-3-X8]AZH83927.1 NAD-dependent deacetylase [Plantibacter sp. PA-3-X8]